MCKGPSLSPFVLINRPTLPFPPTDRSVVFRDSAIRKRTRYNLYDERGGDDDDDDDVMLASPQKCQPQSAASYSFHPCCPPAARWVGRWFGKRSYVPLCHLTFRLPGVGVCVCVYEDFGVGYSGGSSESDLHGSDSVFGINSGADYDAGIDSDSESDSGIYSEADSGDDCGTDYEFRS